MEKPGRSKKFSYNISAMIFNTLSKKDFPNIPSEFRVPGSMVFVAPETGESSSPATWWQFIPGANWKNPEGPNSSIKNK